MNYIAPDSYEKVSFSSLEEQISSDNAVGLPVLESLRSNKAEASALAFSSMPRKYAGFST
ncbi:MAG: hypothetical protein Q8R57_01935 [Bacteroidota bacterium]|nr:hypothetical protein [Bacteroidota bacterium]